MMDCAKAKEYLHSYIDDALSAKTRRELEQHLLTCPDCTAELETIQSLSKALRALPEEELPPGFSQAFHEKLVAEPAPPRRTFWQQGWAKGLAAAAGLVLIIGALSLGGNALSRNMLNFGSSGGGTVNSAPMPAPAAAPAEMSAPFGMDAAARDMTYMLAQEGEKAFIEESLSGEAAPVPESPQATAGADILEDGGAEQQMERKIIKDASLSLRVDDFQAAYHSLNELAAHYGGYVVSSDAYGYDGEKMYRGYVQLRVEAARLEEALQEIESLGQTENQSIYTQDVTMTYYDIEGRLAQYKTQEQRLLDIMRKAETVEDLIKLESELTRVRAELESLAGQLRYYDQMTSLSSINVSLYQPDAHTQTVRLSGWAGFMRDIKEAFIGGINWLLRGCAGLIVGIFRLLPIALVLALVVGGIIIFLRKRRK